ncbi:MAG TPA: hypothetical protein VKB95_08580 [Chitinophagaceae bacterium]|nr:hypothetical protein [Chitinophagaceae bacterium]
MKTKISTRLIAIALVAAFTTALTSPAFANDDKKNIPVELKFVGNIKSQPVFHLVFDSPEETEYTIIISDEFGNSFFKETVKGTRFIRKFLLNTEELDGAKLKFEVSSKKYDKPVVFEIGNETRFVEEIVINRLK